MGVVDLFDRVKISQPQTLFDCAFLYDKEPLLFGEVTATGGAATWQTNKSCVDMVVTSSVGSRVSGYAPPSTASDKPGLGSGINR